MEGPGRQLLLPTRCPAGLGGGVGRKGDCVPRAGTQPELLAGVAGTVGRGAGWQLSPREPVSHQPAGLGVPGRHDLGEAGTEQTATSVFPGVTLMLGGGRLLKNPRHAAGPLPRCRC